MAAQGKVQIVRSSLPYQILLYLNGWYFGLFWIAEALIFIFKGQTLPYPSDALAAEIALLFVMAALEALRLFFGKKGNLTERVLAVAWCIILSVPSLFCALYLIIWQTYVLRVEVIIVAIQITFIGLQLLFGVISCITFARATPY